MKNFLARPSLTEKEVRKVKEVIDSAWPGPNGPAVKKFESEIQDFLGGDRFVLATNSGTSALHLALLTKNVGPGDYVITPSLAYAAGAFAVKYCGAEPLFIGAETDTWNIDIKYLEQAAVFLEKRGELSRLKAILVVHNFGLPNDMDRVLDFAEKYKLHVIEDAAEAFGSEYKGSPAGSLAEQSVFSFNANKIITTGGGGALICEKEEDFIRAHSLANMSKADSNSYVHNGIGYNYTMNSIAAAIGSVQISRIHELLAEREEKRMFYEQELGSLFDFQKTFKGFKSNNWIVAGISRNPLNPEIFHSKSLEVKAIFSPLHLIEPFKSSPYFGSSVILENWQNGICLPSGSMVNLEEVKRELISLQS